MEEGYIRRTNEKVCSVYGEQETDLVDETRQLQWLGYVVRITERRTAYRLGKWRLESRKKERSTTETVQAFTMRL